MQNPILQSNLLMNGYKFYKLAEDCLDVHLGVADKLYLNRYLDNRRHANGDDLYYDLYKHLSELGFNSTAIRNTIDGDKKCEKYWAKIFMEGKKTIAINFCSF